VSVFWYLDGHGKVLVKHVTGTSAQDDPSVGVSANSKLFFARRNLKSSQPRIVAAWLDLATKTWTYWNPWSIQSSWQRVHAGVAIASWDKSFMWRGLTSSPTFSTSVGTHEIGSKARPGGISLGAGRLARTAVVTPDNGIIFAGHTNVDGKLELRRPWLAVVSGDVNEQSQATIPITQGRWGAVHGMRRLKDGTLILAGYTSNKSNSWAWLARSSRWGKIDCKATGKCADKGVTGCSDNNPCTRDLCDPAGGCQHIAGSTLKCSRPNTCSSGGKCINGKCIGTPHGRYRMQGGEGSHHESAGLLRRKDGTVWNVLGRGSYTGLWMINKHWRNLTSGPTGDFSSQTIRCLGHVDVRCHTRANNRFVCVGGGKSLYKLESWAPKNKQNSSYVCGFGPQTLPATEWQYEMKPGCSGCKVTSTAAAEHSTGTVFAIAKQTGSNNAIVFTRLDKAKQPTANTSWHKLPPTVTAPHVYLQDKGYDVHPTAFVVRSDASLVLVGNAVAKGKSSGLVKRVGNDGKVLWTRIVQPAVDSGLYAIASRTDEEFIAGGHMRANSLAYRHWLIAHDSNGKKLWEKTPSSYDSVSIRGILVDKAGLVLGGDVKTPKGNWLWASRRDVGGGVVWARAYQPHSGRKDAHMTPGAIVAAIDGGTHIGGKTLNVTGTSGPSNPAHLRIGPWGEVDCSTLGKCDGKKLADCDDGKACTADLCDAKKGCVHKPIAAPGC